MKRDMIELAALPGHRTASVASFVQLAEIQYNILIFADISGNLIRAYCENTRTDRRQANRDETTCSNNSESKRQSFCPLIDSLSYRSRRQCMVQQTYLRAHHCFPRSIACVRACVLQEALLC